MGFTAFLVDDDPGVLKALCRIMRSAGYEARAYASPAEFLRDHDTSLPGCAVLDLNMPGLDGLELQRRLAGTDGSRPIIFLSGTGDIPTSVQAMKAGAIDFLTKPVKQADLLAAIARAEQQDAAARQMRSERQSVEDKLERLTPRERQVLGHVVAGRLNKQIAASLGTVEKTIKVHRGRMMAKLGIRSVADLVRLAERANVEPYH
jgi:FixJ family two-component response regulator